MITVNGRTSILIVAISVMAPWPAGGQARRPQGEFSVGAFAPVVDLGAAAGFAARLRPGVDFRLGGIFDGAGAAALRVAVGVVPATTTRVRPTAACISDCTERSITTWIVAPGADVLWRSGRSAALFVATGVGLSMYARSTGECVELAGRFCPSRFVFTKAVTRPTARVGLGYGGRVRHRFVLEADDYVTPIASGRVQNDLWFGVGARF